MHSSYQTSPSVSFEDLTQAGQQLQADEYRRTKDEFVSKVFAFIDMVNEHDVSVIGDVEVVTRLLQDINTSMDKMTDRVKGSDMT